MPANKQKNIPFQLVVAALLDENTPFPPTYLHRFSKMAADELEQLKRAWLQVNPARRLALLEDLEDLVEGDTLVILDDIARFALLDPDPAVRTTAIRMLWDDPDVKLVETFTGMLRNDPEPVVRAAAASAIGLFVYLGELEEVPENIHHQVEDELLRVMGGPDQAIVRRRALESLGYSGREEVIELIQNGYENGDLEWLASALFAMGRSADPRWERSVLDMLRHEDTTVQTEAARAAGALELAAAREPLLELLEEPQALDDDLYAAAVWSLSQIGGEDVRETLERMAEAADDDEDANFLEQALENLDFTEGFGVLDMFDFDENEDDEPGSNGRLGPGGADEEEDGSKD